MREYLLDQGYPEINSPKSVLRTAFADNFIDDDKARLSLINSRNLASHLYSEYQAEIVYKNLAKTYVSLFEDLIENLS